MGGILEDIRDILTVGPLQCGGQAQGEFRCEVGQDLLVCIGGDVVGFVYYDAAEVIRLEPLQIQRYPFHRSDQRFQPHRRRAPLRGSVRRRAAGGDEEADCPDIGYSAFLHQGNHSLSERSP